MRKGDKIRFLDAVGGGVILQYDIDKQLVWVETEDGFDVGPIPANKCVLCESADKYQRIRMTTTAQQRKETVATPPTAQTAPAKRPKKQRDEFIVDLHLDALSTSGNGMSDVEKHQYQLRFFRMQMQQHLRHRGRRVVVIHGKGNGVLRNEIRQIIKRDFGTQVEMRDADFARYEEGATLFVVK